MAYENKNVLECPTKVLPLQKNNYKKRANAKGLKKCKILCIQRNFFLNIPQAHKNWFLFFLFFNGYVSVVVWDIQLLVSFFLFTWCLMWKLSNRFIKTNLRKCLWCMRCHFNSGSSWFTFLISNHTIYECPILFKQGSFISERIWKGHNICLYSISHDSVLRNNTWSAQTEAQCAAYVIKFT